MKIFCLSIYKWAIQQVSILFLRSENLSVSLYGLCVQAVPGTRGCPCLAPAALAVCAVFTRQWFSVYTLNIYTCFPPFRGLCPPAARQPISPPPPPPPPPSLWITVAKKLTYLPSCRAASLLLCLLMTSTLNLSDIRLYAKKKKKGHSFMVPTLQVMHRIN